nr:hypothetical protein [Tanacetum cinerariifolium]
MDIELVKGSEKTAKSSEKAEEGSFKRAAGNLEQEDAKRQRIKEENGSTELKRCLEIIPRDDDDNMVYYLLVEKMYPFIRNVIHQMWNDVKLQVDYEVEMAYDLLRLLGGRLVKAMYLNEVFRYIPLITIVGRVYADRDEIKDLSEKR